MVFTEGLRNGVLEGGYFSACRLLTLSISNSLCSGISTYDGRSIESKTKYDEIFIVLGGKARIVYGPGFSRKVDATEGDVAFMPKGNTVKYEGEKVNIFYTLYPVDWQSRTDADLPAGAPVPDVRLIRSKDLAS